MPGFRPRIRAAAPTCGWIDAPVADYLTTRELAQMISEAGVDLPAMPELHLYLKDESTHPTGSLKHRLARSLFLYGLCNGKINEGAAVVEASSGFSVRS